MGWSNIFEPRGVLLAWDPVAQSEAWRVPLAFRWNGGVLTTASNPRISGRGRWPTMPALAPRQEVAFVPYIDLPSARDAVTQGAALYNDYCGICHGGGRASTGAMPNLQQASPATHATFEQIVLGGLRETGGIPSFAGQLAANDVRLIQAYVVSEARKTIAGSAE